MVSVGGTKGSEGGVYSRVTTASWLLDSIHFSALLKLAADKREDTLQFILACWLEGALDVRYALLAESEHDRP
jgi:hypothetical protein